MVESWMLAVAEEQDGVIRRTQLVEKGLTDSGIHRRLKSGALVEIIAGYYRPGCFEPTWKQQARASAWWAGENATLCGPTAAALYGIGGYQQSGPIWLSGPGGKKLPRVGYDLRLIRRDVDPCDRRLVQDLPVVAVERTLMDLGRDLDPHRLERVFDDALIKNLTDSPRLHECFNRLKGYGRKGAGAFREILRLRARTLVRVDSHLEATFLKLFDSQKLRLPEARWWVREDGQYYRLDFAYVDELLAIEIDGDDHQGARLLYDSDRQNTLSTWGWRFLRFRPEHLNNPRETAYRIRKMLALIQRAKAA